MALLPDPDSALLKKFQLRIDTDNPLYPGLKMLKIRGRDLNDFPLEVYHLDQLEVLDLSPEREACINYRMTRLPPGIGNLVALRVLMLDTNEMDEIPAEITYLTQLEKLSLSNNFLTALPGGFNRLHNLTTLYLANNRFSQFPVAIFELLELRFLDLSDNMLTDLPPAIGRLQCLESLLLAYNKITQLPDSLCDMVNLHLLWIGYNRLRSLPANFSRLVNLDWGINGHMTSLAVDGNPLVYPPVDVVKQGVVAIGDYMAQYPGGGAGLHLVHMSPSPPPPPPILLERAVTPVVQLNRRYSQPPVSRPASLPPVAATGVLSEDDHHLRAVPSQHHLTYYGANGR